MTPNTTSAAPNGLRRIFNSVDKLFHSKVLQEEVRFTRSGLTTSGALTMGAVYALCQNIAEEFEWRPSLTMIAAPEGTDRMGMAHRWEFFFNLTKKRAKLECTWTMKEDGAEAQIEVCARPFPPADSPLHQQVAQGQLLLRQVIGLWKQECRNQPPLPKHFNNSDTALIKFVQQGFDPATDEFSLTAKTTEADGACWILQTRDKMLQIPYAWEAKK